MCRCDGRKRKEMTIVADDGSVMEAAGGGDVMTFSREEFEAVLSELVPSLAASMLTAASETIKEFLEQHSQEFDASLQERIMGTMETVIQTSLITSLDQHPTGGPVFFSMQELLTAAINTTDSAVEAMNSEVMAALLQGDQPRRNTNENIHSE